MISDLDLQHLPVPGRVLPGTPSQQARAWKSMFDAFLLEHVVSRHHRFVPFSTTADHPAYLSGRPPLEGIRAFLTARGVFVPDGGPGDGPGAPTLHGLLRHQQAILGYLVAAEAES